MSTQSLQKLDEKLQAMVGKTFLVNAIAHKLVQFRIEDSQLIIVTDKKWFTPVHVDHSSRLLEQFLETDEEPALPAVVKPPVALEASGDLKSILLDNIKRVQEDRNYIPQAAEIGNQIKTLIDLAKTEIAYNRMIKEM